MAVYHSDIRFHSLLWLVATINLGPANGTRRVGTILVDPFLNALLVEVIMTTGQLLAYQILCILTRHALAEDEFGAERTFVF